MISHLFVLSVLSLPTSSLLRHGNLMAFHLYHARFRGERDLRLSDMRLPARRSVDAAPYRVMYTG